MAATASSRDDLVFSSDETLTWFASSPECRRGFCNRCGGNLFYECDGLQIVSIFAGVLDDVSDLPVYEHHLFAEQARAYERKP